MPTATNAAGSLCASPVLPPECTASPALKELQEGRASRRDSAVRDSDPTIPQCFVCEIKALTVCF